MALTPIEHDDSIDIIKILLLIWQGKWKVISFTFLAVLSSYFYILLQPPKSFTATTELRPISSVEEEKYSLTNSYIEQLKQQSIEEELFDEIVDDAKRLIGLMEFPLVNSIMLQELYIEELRQNKIFEEAIIEFKLISPQSFKSDDAYEEAVVKMASRIKFIEPSSEKNKKNIDEENNSWKIEFNHNDEDKWKQILYAVNNRTNIKIQNILKDRIDRSISIANRKINYEIDDTLIDINNDLIDYKNKTKNLLVYLKEQAEIARELGLSKSTVEAQLMSVQNIMMNSKLATPYYLKGYEAIEKEIQLIQSREDTNAFIDGIVEKESKIMNLRTDKSVDRIKELFEKTPIANSKDFSAADLRVEATKFKYINNDLIIIALSGVIAFFVSILYLIISNAFRERQEVL